MSRSTDNIMLLNQVTRAGRPKQALPFVCSVDIAQDHMLCVCASSPPGPRTQWRMGLVEKPSDAGPGAPDDDEPPELSLWVWGRRKLCPSGIGGADRKGEAVCRPVKVPREMLGQLGAEGASVLELGAMCGGSHSLVFGKAADGRRLGRSYDVAWCPQMCTVKGQGIRGGRALELLDLHITSRNEDGRDEWRGGLRFRIRARPGERRVADRSAKDERPDAFSLQKMVDHADGTYEAQYSIDRPGDYLLHVVLLRPDAPLESPSDSDGEPVAGSPFRVSVTSGPASAQRCELQLRAAAGSGKAGAKSDRQAATAPPSAPQGADASEPAAAAEPKPFEVAACTDAVWDILVRDVLGNASTLKSDRFLAQVDFVEEQASAAQDCEDVLGAAQVDLATALGLPPVAKGGSAATTAIFERKRQRDAERLWARQTTMSATGGAFGAFREREKALPSRIPLQVKILKDPA